MSRSYKVGIGADKGSSGLPRPKKPKKPGKKALWVTIILLLVGLIAGSVLFVRYTYNEGLKPVSAVPKAQVVTIKSGSSVDSIAKDLAKAKLIRNEWAFKWYVHRQGVADKLQAGTFALSPNQDVPTIVTILTKGRPDVQLVTILPGRRLDQVRADFINVGFSPAAVDQALDPAQYADLPILAYKPAEVNNLEGLLWPDSYEKDANSEPSDIIRQSLEDMGEQITPEVQAAFAAQNLTVYQGITLASIILQEVNDPTDQAQVAQVFLSRLKADMKLQSDPTAKYGAIQAGQVPDLEFSSPHNTYLNKGLPPTPIGTINADALFAATHPSATDWLYFVSGDDGTTYFSRTLEEHEALTNQHCTVLCQ